MRHVTRKRFLFAAIAAAGMLLSAGQGQACLFFGCCGLFGGPANTSYYAPSYTSRLYAPRVSYYYAPVSGVACAPCGISSCSPCGPSGCPSGSCGVTSGGGGGATTDEHIMPSPDNGTPKTYREGETNKTVPDDSGFRPRASDDAQPKLPDEDGGTDLFQERETKKIPETVIPQRKSAPTKEPVDDSADEKSKSETKGTQIPALNLDQKITSRSTPERTRLVIRARYTNPTIARKNVTPNPQWLPAFQGTKIVRR